MITKSLIEIREMLAKKQVSSVEVTKAVLARIEDKKPLNSFITVCRQEALAMAAEADRRLAAGETDALLGVPIAVKDNLSTDGIRTTCASKILDNYIPPFDAFAVEKIKKAGGVIIGKTNMDEFAMGVTGEYSAYGASLNAIDPTRVAGGSSGGSAAAVASFQCYGALGTDTGGSLRQPAAFNGIAGLKPTYSVVSRFGAIAFASSLDQVGAMGRNVADTKALYDVIKGYDKRDTTSYKGDYEADKFSESLTGKKIGIAKEFFPASLNGEISAALQKVIKVYQSLGAIIVDVSIPTFDMALACYSIISCAEAASNLARFDGIKYGKRAANCATLSEIYTKTRTEFFGEEVKRRIMWGNFTLTAGHFDAYYMKALKARTLIKRDFDIALSECDVMLTPVSPRMPFKLGKMLSDAAALQSTDMFTAPANIAGVPALTVKCGEDGTGLPIGVQLIGGNYKENTLLGFAAAYEEAK